MDKSVGKSKGILEGLSLTRKDNKNEKGLEENNKGILEVEKETSKLKRSYCLTLDTIEKLERMKLDDFPRGTSLENIVEKAIIDYYENNHKS